LRDQERFKAPDPRELRAGTQGLVVPNAVVVEPAPVPHPPLAVPEEAEELGLVSQRGNVGLAPSILEKLLRNPFYIGLFIYHGETHEATHEPLINTATFEAVQRVLADKSKPRKQKQIVAAFPYRGLFSCAECSRQITAETHTKKNGLVFRYYRCTKKGTICRQKYIREQELERQIDAILAKVAVSDDWATKMLGQIGIWQREQTQSSARTVADLTTKLGYIDKRLSKLLDLHLDDSLEASEYQAKKAELISQKVALKTKIRPVQSHGQSLARTTQEVGRTGSRGRKTDVFRAVSGKSRAFAND
jgi:hypothetical protein